MSELPKSQINYYGLVLGKFPVLAVIVTRQPRAIGDLPAEYLKMSELEASSVKDHPASTSVAIGLLGVEIPLKRH